MISIALPDSLFVDDKADLRAKTAKAGTIARAASIFGVERVYIYRDSSGNFDSDYLVARSILEYAEMPQYLRRRLLRKHRDLQYVGLLPPLRIPHHMTMTDAKSGEVREASLPERLFTRSVSPMP